MTAGARRIAHHDGVVALALPERRAPRAVLVPEVVSGEPRRRPVVDDADDVEIVVPLFVSSGAAYREPAAPLGLLVDVYG